MAKNKGSLNLRVEKQPDGSEVGFMVYRGPHGKRRLTRPVQLSMDLETREAELTQVVDEGKANVVLPGQTRE